MSDSLPLVSTVIAAYNYERYLGEALESALAQDWPADRLEIIVVDDGSTDGTPEMAQRYASEHPGRVRYIRQENAGPAAATSTGLAKARGELIALLDADDVWVRSRTRLLVDALRRNRRAGLVYGDMEVIDSQGATIARSWLEEAAQTPFHGRCVAHFLRSNFIMTSSLMVRADLRERFCPLPAWFHTQDWPIAARVAEVADIEFLPAVVARYRRHGGNLTNGRHSQHEAASMLRRDAPMRRWMMANLRSSDLTVEDLVAAFDYFCQALRFAAGALDERPESFLDADPERERAEHAAGDAALADGDFVSAASHFLAALAANPFSVSARHGLDHAKRRLVVPAPRRIESSGAARDYGIKPGYVPREAPEYYVDLVEERTGVLHQPDVYAHAADVAGDLGATRIVDLGAGGGDKLATLSSRFEVLGLDQGPNVELARRKHPDVIWREHNLDAAGPLPLALEELELSVLVCANVIEQLARPEHLLVNLREALRFARAIVISTPERDLTHGVDHVGPPADRTRVREWNTEEFAALLEGFGFNNGELGLTRSDNVTGARDTILAVLYPVSDGAGYE